MSLTAAERKTLHAFCAGRPQADLKRVFGLIRAHNDDDLLAGLSRAGKRSPKASDPLLRDLTQTLRPLMAPAAEKAELLIGHMARKRRLKLKAEPRGLADAARRLRVHFSDDEIRDGARAMIARLSKLHGSRETVV